MVVQAEVIPNRDGYRVTPSYVSFGVDAASTDKCLAGNSAALQAISNPQNASGAPVITCTPSPLLWHSINVL